MMKIAYITRARMPTEKAHGLQIAKMCEAYASLGCAVTLVVPYRKNVLSEDVATFYGVADNFVTRVIWVPDLIGWSFPKGKIAFWLHGFLFLVRLLFFLPSRDTVIVTRSAEIAWLYSILRYQTIYEAHNWPHSSVGAYISLLRNASLIVCNSRGTAEEFTSRGFSNVLVAANAVDLETLKPTVARKDMRRRSGISEDAFVILYAGALEKWKGVDTLLQAASRLSFAQVVIAGGAENEVAELCTMYPSVRFLGTTPYAELGNYQSMADILVIPNDPKDRQSRLYTSPIKLFAHMNAGIPIVVTDLPSMREVVSENEVWFFDGSVDSLVDVVQAVHQNKREAEQRSRNAVQKGKCFTWTRRAQKILDRITSINSTQ